MKQKINKFLFILSLMFFFLFILLINKSFASAPEMPDTGYNSNLMLYDRISDKFYLFSISNNFQNGYGSYTDEEDGLVKKFFYLQKEDNNKGITIYRIHSYRIWENNEWVVQKNIGHTKYDSFDITLQTTEEDLYIVSCSSAYKTNGVVFDYYSSLLPDFYQFPDKKDITVDTFKFSQVLSKNYPSEFYNTYNAYISLDGVNWDTMSKEYSTADDSAFIFYYDVFENGTYQVRIFDESIGQYIYDDVVGVDNIPFEIYFEPSENTDKPLLAKSNIFGPDSRLQYSVYLSTDKKEWTSINSSQVEPNEENPPDMRDTYFWTRIFKNGIYYFRFTYFDEVYEGDTLVSATTIHYYVTKEVKNLLVEDYMSDDYIFKPEISLDFDKKTESFIIRTQSILLDKALNLNCFYISYDKSEGFNPNDKVEEENILGWNKMEIGFENNIYMNTSDGYFYFEIPAINATDTSYKIVFYNYISEKASEIVYYDFIYESAKDYVENGLKIHLGISVRLNDLLKSFESRFGILGFPMSVLRNFSNKILTLQLKEPVIYIPALYDPFYHNKIFNGISFNFNSLLVSDSVIFVHEFYLTIVDMIFIYLFLKFCVKTLRDFIEKDK